MPDAPRHELTDARMKAISDLVGQIVQQGQGFKIFPPKEITIDPTVLQADDVVDRLADAKFWLRLEGGTEEILTLPELLALTYNLLAVKKQLMEAKRRAKGKRGVSGVEISVTVALKEMMQPDNARALLKRVIFEGVPTAE